MILINVFMQPVDSADHCSYNIHIQFNSRSNTEEIPFIEQLTQF